MALSKKNNKTRIKINKIFWLFYFSFLLVLVVYTWCLTKGWIFTMPDISEFEHPTANVSSQILGNDGTLIGKYYIEDRITLNYNELNNNIIAALISTEDKRYYQHYGIDFESFLRALIYLGNQGGASTLTQQTAKNLFTENWNTRNKIVRLFQKYKELIIAIKLERYFTKNEIITIYLNSVTFSENLFGIKNAAKTFFQKNPNKLTVTEAALLVGMINAPTLYNPRRNAKQSFERRNLVIKRMRDQGYISTEKYNKIKALPIQLFYKKLDQNTGLAPYFRMILGEDLKQWCKKNKKANGENYNLYSDGLKIYTTISPLFQTYAEEAVEFHMKKLQTEFDRDKNIKTSKIWNKKSNKYINSLVKQTDRYKTLKSINLSEKEIENAFNTPVAMSIFKWNNFHYIDTIMTPLDSIKYHSTILQAGFLAIDPFSGEVKAWVGGIDFKLFKYDHINIKTKRQVGSTIKPLLYSFAIENKGFSPYSLVDDVQQDFDGYNKVPATDKSCSGETMTMARALAESRNCASAFILKKINPIENNSAKEFIDYLRKTNIISNLEPYPSIALGSEEISVYEMIQSFSMFPGNGYVTKPFYITRIEDKNGNLLANFVPLRKKVISEKTAYTLIKMMQGVMTNGTGQSIWRYNLNTDAIAGKTGTTNNNSDLWFIGFTPQLLSAAWVGCDDRSFVFSNDYWGQGAHGAMPIWAYFYEKVLADKDFLQENKSFMKPQNYKENPDLFLYEPLPDKNNEIDSLNIKQN